MLQYTQQFINNYQRVKWAAFLNFGEAHEDSGYLSGILDNDLSKFLKWMINQRDSRTVVVMVSDHGLHYGPSFQSFSGECEISLKFH